MHPLTAPFLAAAVLVAAAGALKLLRPAGTAQALRTQGLPSGRAAVRLLGAAELAVAALALLDQPGGAALLAVAYAGFTAFVALALVRDRPLSSCGCFADPDLPPTWAHVVVTTASSAVAAAGALTGPAGLPQLLAAPGGTALAAAGGAVVVGWLAYLALAELPRVSAQQVELEHPHHGPRTFTLTPVRSASS